LNDQSYLYHFFCEENLLLDSEQIVPKSRQRNF